MGKDDLPRFLDWASGGISHSGSHFAPES